MSKKLREDKTCENCGHHVAERFCPNCGQENTVTRKSFHYLFTHFIEDLLHYDGNFILTAKKILFKPYELTNEYLAGKRKKYVAPVKLYIFVNFIFFLLISFYINIDKDKVKLKAEQHKKELLYKKNIFEIEKIEKEKYKKEQDSLKKIAEKKIDSVLNNTSILPKSISDSIKKVADEDKKDSAKGKPFHIGFSTSDSNSDDIDDSIDLLRIVGKRLNSQKILDKCKYLKENFTSKEISLLTYQNTIASLPKAIFIYLPIFAFMLWLFHSKKKYWYFDHGIFTFHIFSFTLIMILLLLLQYELLAYLDFEGLGIFLNVIGSFYIIFIYLKSMHRVYESKRFWVIFKSMVLFFVHLFIISFFMMSLILFSMYNIV